MIQFFHAGKVFSGQYQAIADVDLHVEKGEFAFLTGPSGSGKSTILRLSAGLIRPTDGQVLVFGRNIGALTDRQLRELRTKIGVVFQDFKLLFDRSVYANIDFALDVTGAAVRNRRKRIESVLDWVGLRSKAQAMPHHLSGGEQQRVAIARAISLNPLLLLADEPTGNLDEEMSLQILELFRDLHTQGTTIMMATHSRAIVESSSYKTVHLSHGKVSSTTF